MRIRVTSIFLTTLIFSAGVLSQRLPAPVKQYLDRNYRGWKLAGCYGEKSNSVLSGDFDGNGKRDYAIKFIRGKQGFLMAFLDKRMTFAPYYLHIWNDPDEARFSSLILFKKGDTEQSGTPILRFDSPADFECDSDVGGVHTYRNGKFIAY